MLSVCDDATIAAERGGKAVILKSTVQRDRKNKASHLLVPRRNLAPCSHVDYSVVAAVSDTMLSDIEPGEIRVTSENLSLCARMS
jgi:hypothetical protein